MTQLRRMKPRSTQIGELQSRIRQVCRNEICTLEVSLVKDDPAEPRLSQIGTCKFRSVEVCGVEDYVS